MNKSQKIIFNRRLLKKRNRKMTLIIGANCIDGIVLVADRKVTGSNRLVDKIRKPANLNVVFTAGGYEGIFEDYLDDITKNVDYATQIIDEENKSSPVHREYNASLFKKTCIETLTELKNTYRALGQNTSFEQILQVLFTIPETRAEKGITRLYKMDMEDCYPQAVDENEVVAIGYSTIAMPFLRSLNENKKFTMKDVARIASFVIKYIEKEDLVDGAVGVKDRQPQIYFAPHGQDLREIIDETELNELLDGVDVEVKKLQNMIGLSSNFLRS